MRKSWYSRIHKLYQERISGGFDTFNSFRKSKNGKKLEHRKARRQLENEKFYYSFKEFIENNKISRNEKDIK